MASRGRSVSELKTGMQELAGQVAEFGVTPQEVCDLITASLMADVGELRNVELLSVYATHADPRLRAVVVLHEASSQDHVLRLSKDANRVVRALARVRLGWRKQKANPEETSGTRSQADRNVCRPLRTNKAPSTVRGTGLSAQRVEPSREDHNPSIERSLEVSEKALTEEQWRVLEHPPEAHLTVHAYAGTGKTSTLVDYATKWSSRSGLYLAFNSAISKEARDKFAGKNVKVMTLHSLAYAKLGIGRLQKHLRKSLSRASIHAAAREVLGQEIDAVAARNILGTLRNYLMSDSTVVLDCHIEAPAADVELAEHREATRLIIQYFMEFTRGGRQFTHDMYLKKFAIEEQARLEVDYVMVDEAQDMNPLMISILQGFHLPLLVVGDEYQAIYAFRGAISAMTRFPGSTAALSRSWRFGKSVAAIANSILECTSRPPTTPVGGNPQRATRICAGQNGGGLVLARTNGRLFEYLLGVNQRFFISGGFDQFRGEILAAVDLSEGKSSTHRSPLPFRTWDELQDAGEDGDPTAMRLVRLLGSYGGARLRKALNELRENAVENVEDAEVHLSTAHKAKGLESDSVTMLDDFVSLSERRLLRSKAVQEGTWNSRKQEAFDQEHHLLYVSATRAKYQLHLPPALLSDVT